MFTQPCFIKDNTSCIRDKLEEFGYKPFLHNLFSLPYLSTKQDGFYFQTDANRDEALECNTVETFLAIAALRDDSNDKQFFICTESDKETELVKGEFRVYEDCLFHYEDGDIVFPAYYWKKATVNELIEHFNSK